MSGEGSAQQRGCGRDPNLCEAQGAFAERCVDPKVENTGLSSDSIHTGGQVSSAASGLWGSGLGVFKGKKTF